MNETADIFNTRLAKLKGTRADDSIADAVGVYRTTFSRYRNGRTKPDIEVLANICRCLNTTPDYLLGWSDDPTDKPEIKEICDYTGLPSVMVEYFHKWIGKSYLPDFFDLPTQTPHPPLVALNEALTRLASIARKEMPPAEDGEARMMAEAYNQDHVRDPLDALRMRMLEIFNQMILDFIESKKPREV